MKMLKTKALYAAPIAIASTAIAVSLIAPQIARASTSTLAPVTPSQLVSWIQASHPVPLNGTVTGTTSFPVPLPSVINGSSSQGLPSGSTTENYNVWTNGDGSFRAQQVTASGETDLYVNPGSVWLWDSATFTATSETPPSGTSQSSTATASNPQLTASQIVSKLATYSTLTVSGDTMVAGRPAYTLSIVPLASDSLIGSINIAVDGTTHIADQIQVFPKGSNSPAASMGFDTLTFASQPSSIFAFTPPADAKVVTGGSKTGTSTDSSTAGNTSVVGSGFDTVVVATPSAKMLSSLGTLVKALPAISTPLGQGHLYSTPIFDAILLPNGKVVAGAVDTARLLQVIAGL